MSARPSFSPVVQGKKEPNQDQRCSGTCSGGNPCWHGAGHGGSHQCPTCPH